MPVLPEKEVAEPLAEELAAGGGLSGDLHAEPLRDAPEDVRMDGREGPEVVVWREVRDLYRVDVVVGTGRRAGVMGGSGVAGCEVGPHSELELAVTLEKVAGVEAVK